nr:sulfotransferase [Rhabdothermincola salaria]
MIIGAQKCGTTSLAVALGRHPDIFVPAGKEAHHFGTVHDAGVGGEDYAGFFAGWQGERLIGEATPEYLYLPSAPRQILGYLPEVRLVAMLRDPVDRAWSAYWHGVRTGVIRGSFEQALDDEARVLGRGRYSFTSLVDRGRYVTQLRRYEAAGLDRAALHVVIFEELVADPVAGVEAVQRFLGVEPLALGLELRNPARLNRLPAVLRGPVWRRRGTRWGRHVYGRSLVPFTPPPMAPATRACLVEAFAPYNEALATWLGRDLPWSTP